MLESIGPGQTLLADRGYDSDALRQNLADRGAWANVKPMPGRVNIPAFSPYLYRFRKLVERFFNKLKHFRTIATRYEKHDANYLALVKLAADRIWMRFMGRSPSLRTPSSIYKERKDFVYGIGSVMEIILMVAADGIIVLVPILQSLADVGFEGMPTVVAE
jgi:transposase